MRTHDSEQHAALSTVMTFPANTLKFSTVMAFPANALKLSTVMAFPAKTLKLSTRYYHSLRRHISDEPQPTFRELHRQGARSFARASTIYSLIKLLQTAAPPELELCRRKNFLRRSQLSRFAPRAGLAQLPPSTNSAAKRTFFGGLLDSRASKHDLSNGPSANTPSGR